MRDSGTADLFIRASQGHSWTLEAPWSLYKYIALRDIPAGRPAPYPDVAIHGTRWAAFEGIMWIGLFPAAESTTPRRKELVVHTSTLFQRFSVVTCR
eukprot:1736552-Pyramimonas_sp.AAC.1